MYCAKCGTFIPAGEKACQSCGCTRQVERPFHEIDEDYRPSDTFDTSNYNMNSDSNRYEEPSFAERDWAPQRRNEEPDEAEHYERESYEAPHYEPPSYEYAVETKASGNGIAVLCYLGLLLLIPLLMRKNDPFIRFHANQGLLLFLLTTVSGILFGDGIIGAVISLLALGGVVMGISNVLKGKMVPLPVIGKIRLIR